MEIVKSLEVFGLSFLHNDNSEILQKYCIWYWKAFDEWRDDRTDNVFESIGSSGSHSENETAGIRMVVRFSQMLNFEFLLSFFVEKNPIDFSITSFMEGAYFDTY